MTRTPDVAPDQLIQSSWGNEIRDRSIQVFASASELNTSWSTAPNGSRAITLDTYRTYTRRGGVWQPDFAGGFVTATTNASGFPPLQAHDLGRVPVAVILVNGDTAANLLSISGTPGASNFQVLGRLTTTGAALNAVTIHYYWFAW